MAKNRLKVCTFSTHPFINNEFVVTNDHHRALKSFCVQNCRQLGVPAIQSLGLSSALPLLFPFLIHRWRSSKLSDYNNFNGISFNAHLFADCASAELICRPFSSNKSGNFIWNWFFVYFRKEFLLVFSFFLFPRFGNGNRSSAGAQL